MTSIIKANIQDCQLLTTIGKISFIESHGDSASEQEINSYVNAKYNNDAFSDELKDPENIYHIIYHDRQPAGYSKMVFNAAHSNIQKENVTKLERIYLLKEFYMLGLGHELLNFNIQLSRQNHQTGMWLFVWKENDRALHFYNKTGFKVIGSYDFKLSETHSNPNHQMLLIY